MKYAVMPGTQINDEATIFEWINTQPDILVNIHPTYLPIITATGIYESLLLIKYGTLLYSIDHAFLP